MRRMNVQFSQIEECIRLSMFAIDALPAAHPLQRGEPLLLQLVKEDAKAHDLLDRRIQFALIFDHVKPDPTGEISRRHWPLAGKTWKYILYCSETVPTIPFSLERLGLSRDYSGQGNAVYIEPQDEPRVRPYLKGETRPELLLQLSSVQDLLAAIRNHDQVVTIGPERKSTIREHQRRMTDPWLSDALKLLYDHRCQICLHDFKPRYGVPFADTRFITSPEQGGKPVSRNLVVLCPNHDAIIGAAKARFEPRQLAFAYPNGLEERLTLRDHLLN